MTKNWQTICAEILDGFDATEDWVKKNSETEEYLRGAIHFKLFDAERDPSIGVFVESFQRSFYTHFINYSVDLTYQLFGDGMPLGEYQQAFSSLSRKKYLQLCADFWCMNLVLSYHNDREVPAAIYLALASMLTDDPDTMEWRDCFAFIDDTPEFNRQVCLRMYRCFAAKIGLPQDEAAIKRAEEDAISNSLFRMFAAHSKSLYEDETFQAHLNEILS